VHDRDLPAAAQGQLERRVGDAFHGTTRDDAVGDGDVRGGHELTGAGEGVAVGVEALGVLPDDDQVGARHDRGRAGERLGRADVGEQVEVLADRATGVEPGAVRLRVRGAVVRAQQPTVQFGQ
jgi:hypothetical protein